MMPVNAGAATPASATNVRTGRRVGNSARRQIRSARAAPIAVSDWARSATPTAHQCQPIAAEPRSAMTAAGTISGTKSVVRVKRMPRVEDEMKSRIDVAQQAEHELTPSAPRRGDCDRDVVDRGRGYPGWMRQGSRRIPSNGYR